METNTIVTYEVVEPVSNKRLFTKDYFVAEEHYGKGCIVYEKHKTTTQPTLLTQTQVQVTVRWNHTVQKEEE